MTYLKGALFRLPGFVENRTSSISRKATASIARSLRASAIPSRRMTSSRARRHCGDDMPPWASIMCKALAFRETDMGLPLRGATKVRSYVLFLFPVNGAFRRARRLSTGRSRPRFEASGLYLAPVFKAATHGPGSNSEFFRRWRQVLCLRHAAARRGRTEPAS